MSTYKFIDGFGPKKRLPLNRPACIGIKDRMVPFLSAFTNQKHSFFLVLGGDLPFSTNIIHSIANITPIEFSLVNTLEWSLHKQPNTPDSILKESLMQVFNKVKNEIVFSFEKQRTLQAEKIADMVNNINREMINEWLKWHDFTNHRREYSDAKYSLLNPVDEPLILKMPELQELQKKLLQEVSATEHLNLPAPLTPAALKELFDQEY